MPEVNPDILVWARETAGLSLGKAAAKLGFKDSRNSSAADKLASIESGDREPTRPQLLKIVDAYRRPLLTFYLSKPPVKGDRGADFRSLPADRTLGEDALLDALVRDIRARQSMVRAVLEDEDEAQPLSFIGSNRIEDGSAAVLASLKQLFDLDLSDYRAQPDAARAFDLLRYRAERTGIFVLIKGDLGNYLSAIDTTVFRGFSIADPVAPFVVINDQDARTAWSFTLLHETVHLLLGQTGISALYADNEVERFCDHVAGEFLLQGRELAGLRLNNSHDIEMVSQRITDFANKNNLSRSMIAYQAYRAGIIREETFSQLNAIFRQEWSAGRERNRSRSRDQEGGPNFYVVRRHRLGGRITNLVQRMMVGGALSTSRAARILGVKPRQVEPLLNPVRPV